MIEVLILCVAIGFVIIAHRLTPGTGCTGDCRQGRDPCNCNNKWEK